MFLKNLSVLLIAMMLINAANSQVMQAKSEWVSINVPQLKCWECKQKLERYLFQEQGPNNETGILQWHIYMTTGLIRIQFMPDRIDAGYIRTAIANAGFDADTVKAATDAYNKLPPICKRKEEGGGPQKGKPCNIEPVNAIIFDEQFPFSNHFPFIRN